jgi:hypothetical protein
VVVWFAGCSFRASPAQSVPSDGSDRGSDAGGGSGIDATQPPLIDGAVCFGNGVVRVCLDAVPTKAVTLPGAMNPLDTGIDDNCTTIWPQTAGPALCVIAGMTVTVSGSFAATGARPLVLIGVDAVTVSATLDVSSKIAGGVRRGAGANDSACAVGTNGKNDSGGGGGGAGGSFGTSGGAGGTGDLNNNHPPAGTATGGAPGAAQPAPAVLRGGCKGSFGGDGGDTPATQTGGVGGDGGGAVYLIAGNTITITGAGGVFASGAGGAVAAGTAGLEQGAGGGGSGGMIVLDAPALQVQGRIAANGGAGAGGGADIGGMPGGDGTTTMWDKRAPGGNGDKNPAGDAGDGADGSTINMATNLGAASADAGGGGAAGGLGLVWTWGTVTGGTMVSPAPVKH